MLQNNKFTVNQKVLDCMKKHPTFNNHYFVLIIVLMAQKREQYNPNIVVNMAFVNSLFSMY